MSQHLKLVNNPKSEKIIRNLLKKSNKLWKIAKTNKLIENRLKNHRNKFQIESD